MPVHRARNRRSRSFHALLLMLCSGVAAWSIATRAGPALALAQIDISARPLAEALTAFSLQSGIPVLYEGDLTRNLRSTAVHGSMAPDTALRQLLQGTGLGFRHGSNGGISLFRAAAVPAPSGAVVPSDVHALPKVRVSAAAIPPDQAPYNTAYNRLDATTATKTDTPIMETPFNIQVVPRQIMRDQQAVRMEKALQNVSGVYAANFAGQQNNFFIRGFEVNQYYIDGIRVFPPLNLSTSREVANLQRIEVLKGPASMLFGRIEPGGLINAVRKQPLSQRYFALEQQFGSFDFYRTTADATGPITSSDTLLYRFNLAYESARSFRDFVNNERIFVAPMLRWNISPQTQMNVYLEYLHSPEYLDPGIPALGDRPAPVPRSRNLWERDMSRTFDDTRVGFNWSHEFNTDWKIRQRFDANFSDSSLPTQFFVNPPASTRVCSPASCPLDRFALATPNIDDQVYSGSLDLLGKLRTWEIEHSVLIGGDFLNSHNFSSFSGNFSNSSPIDLFHPIHTGFPYALLDKSDSRTSGEFDEEWFGFYLQEQAKLPYGIQLVAGFRYDNFSSNSTNKVITPSPTTVTKQSFAEDAVTPRFGVLWQPLPQFSAYGNYVENFGRSNGRSAGGQILPPETAQQWELGIKGEFLNSRLLTTLAWFNLTKQNIAVPDPNPVQAARGFVVPIGEANSSGLEFDISGQISDDIKLIGNYAYTQSIITKDRSLDFDDLDAAGNPAVTNGNQGHRLYGAPRHGGSLWVAYEPQDDFLGLKLGGGVVLRGAAPGDVENDFKLPGYVVVNLMAGYALQFGKSKVSLQLNIDNLLDQTYFPQGGAGFRGNITVGAPRSFLGSVRVEF